MPTKKPLSSSILLPSDWTASSFSIQESGYQAVTETVTIPVMDLDASRTKELEQIVSAIDGVLKAVVNAGAETVEVEYIPGQIGLRDIRRAIEKAGFRLPAQAEGRSALDIEKEAREQELSAAPEQTDLQRGPLRPRS